MASSSTEFRLGYWFVTMDNSKEESIILVIKKTEQEVTFRQCNFPLGDQEDNTGKDLYVSHSISKIPTPSLHFLRVAFALSPVAFNRCKTWGPRVFCCMTPGYLNDNADEELEASIAADPEEAELEFDWSKASPVLPEAKAVLHMRVDREVLEYFRKQGKGYQTKINSVLASYVQAQSR